MDYQGTLRPRITVRDGQPVQVEWLASGGEIIWTENVILRDHRTFASQIECTGEFRIVPGHFVDDEGRRHFVLQAELGRLGVAGKETA